MTLEKDFPKAVENDLGLAFYQSGLKALKSVDRKRVQLKDSRLCFGSADIDAAMKQSQPNANRWDYVIAVDQALHFIEVHPAHTSEVSEIAKKKAWLESWLKSSQLGTLAKRKHFHWIASKNIAITKNSRQWRAAVQMGLKPETGLKI